MNTKHSGIRRLFAAKKTPHEGSDTSLPAPFLTRLGDIKVETKGPNGLENIDNFVTMERYT
jgi:hypothetical protein